MILKRLVVSPFETNCYIVGCEKTKKAAVIDPGDSSEWIEETAANEGLTIEKIINTHGHVDHTAGVQELKKSLSIPFYLHKDEVELLPAMMDHGRFFGILVNEVPSVDVSMNDGDVLKIGELSAKVIHTPGHTPGGCCFLIDDVILVGDTLFAGSIGRTDLPGGSYDILIRSIKTRLMTLDDDISVYPGHGPSTCIGDEKLSNPFLNT